MYIYKEKEIRQADSKANLNGLSLETLMESAGRGLYYKIKKLIKPNQKILILSGTGNNGGDGIVLARYLKQNQFLVDLVFPFGGPKSDVAKKHLRYYESIGYTWSLKINDDHYDVIIDCMLGVGTKLPLRETYIKVVEWCNEQCGLKISVDLPTGVLSDSGQCDLAFHAHYTFALHGVKPSAYLLPSGKYYGKIDYVDIGLPQTSKWKIWSEQDVKKTLHKRDAYSHKGTFGTGLLIAGTDEMPGSAVLAAKGALKMGIGKLIVGTSKFASNIIAQHVPEATFSFDALDKLAIGKIPERIHAIAIGPGLTEQVKIEQALDTIWKSEIPVILDAGALIKRNYPKRTAPIIITPHPGEFSRLTNISTYEIQQNRIEYAKQYATDHGVIVVLKGTHTVIAFPDGTGLINLTGNAGLAKGGSGDTLVGMLLAFICSEKNMKAAVANAVYLHGRCADILVKEENERSIVASQLSKVIGKVLKEIE
ncbi:NAD(P)H-hydrate dehydratase [Caldibacillus thermolactis]|jgi:ADP-dependent NAD(P)H-hydrate dehydratase / NAD(P)H-hydrate epimerase|uniref:Bifunctional NAD(P)H-hydrate repair enzyme n=1 Tax=Pallidibacillus thermolactis TaxID=251051 RepID=A0ABT2WNM6_9BACI|nr:NAD(P)H-hydrate dehydratase [Pallidibacillus thermolactis]MCU9595547.1 NAD(P)H-hydrate dehydratase [Pallidibacillus thermolactis]MCU9601991.1 NAD(P)H-hydrate dehydratase [Pallidibacillus thermolactis subsp. kokeshiiformis]MED1673584.1 NAD(P)H-hydrate dehydratase [Pallidibacillus thermolactis subsp. kokeshiiformis]